MGKSDSFLSGMMMQVGDLSAPPRLIPDVHEDFHAPIGDLIVNWGLMENQMNILIWSILKHQCANEPAWKTRTFSKRSELLRVKWGEFSGKSKTLSTFLDVPFSNIQRWKVLRDSISHKTMIFGWATGTNGGPFIQFYNKSHSKQMSRKYYIRDFLQGAIYANQTAGWFYWITQPEAKWPLPPQDVLALRGLPETNHLKYPDSIPPPPPSSLVEP